MILSKKLFTIFGVPVFADIGCLILSSILILLSNVAFNVYFSILFVILFWLSILAHEFGHILMARFFNTYTTKVDMFFFGAMAHMDLGELDKPIRIFVVAIIGPLISLLIALLLYLLTTINTHSILHEFLSILLRINLLNGFFNLLPGFPLDGGHCVTAIIWQLTNNHLKGLRISVLSGMIVSGSIIISTIIYFLISFDSSLTFAAMVSCFLLTQQFEMKNRMDNDND